MKRIFFILLFCVLLWSGCRENTQPAVRGLITEIEISCPQEVPASRRFTMHPEMEAILNYLRTAELLDADGQEPLGTRLYTIILTHQDGRETVYYQIDDTWLRKGNGKWYRLDPAQGQKLPRLYQSLPDGKKSGPPS